MLSRSGVRKLKAFLIIDLIIVGAAAGAYFYFASQGIIGVSAKPAKFTVSNLTIDPQTANVGEAVSISVNVTNSGDLLGTIELNFEINGAVKNSQNATMVGNSSQIIQYSDIETQPGNYSVRVGDLTGNFTINPLPPESSKIILSNLQVNPFEVWTNQTVAVSADAQNPTDQPDQMTVKVSLDGSIVSTNIIAVNASTTQTVSFNVTATSEGTHTVKLNTLSGSFNVVKTGYHTLEIARSGGGSTPLTFTLNGQTEYTPYIQLLPVGQYTFIVPNPVNVGTGVLAFSSWSDGSTATTRTITLDSWSIYVCTYNVISGYASCPSLYTWNGTGYSYVTDVCNAGWLGYIGGIQSNGNIIYSGGNPWDYVKLDPTQLALRNIDGTSNYEMVLSQEWDELFYLDAAYMVVVDHPAGTDVYTTMSNYVNQGFNGEVYTVNSTQTKSPVSAINQYGQNVLPDILKADGVYTPGILGDQSSSWNNITQNQLTLDLGNLTGAQQIKLVVTGIVDWGPYQSYYNWIDQWQAAAAKGLVANGSTEIMPSPYMEIMAPNGTWIRAPQDRQIPIPSDSNPRTFVVDLTGLFPAGTQDFKIRLTNFWNVTYDYIGVDTTTQQEITVQNIHPTATLSQFCSSNSTSSGNFTRYGDVTPLVAAADDMYVIGRQGDEVTLDFSTANLTAPAPGMVRDYFLFIACWFKDPSGQWGYGFTFTVAPMPYIAESGFPYTAPESYPADTAHQAYIAQYNTRYFPNQ
jgi:hypothetical protein